ncbi:hypothetical protein BC826DRAFT_428754 [Russula brevipes]|nr:hypothetical protein BC826DRAFT_428754 [Russula brevipes]
MPVQYVQTEGRSFPDICIVTTSKYVILLYRSASQVITFFVSRVFCGCGMQKTGLGGKVPLIDSLAPASAHAGRQAELPRPTRKKYFHFCVVIGGGGYSMGPGALHSRARMDGPPAPAVLGTPQGNPRTRTWNAVHARTRALGELDGSFLFVPFFRACILSRIPGNSGCLFAFDLRCCPALPSASAGAGRPSDNI